MVGNENPWENVVKQMSLTAEVMKLDPNILRIIEKPERIVITNFPVMSHGRRHVEMFEGYRVQHNSHRGPYKGGVNTRRQLA